MAELKNILSLEGARKSISDMRTMHVWHEGGFYRLYEVSAWLFQRFIKDSYKISNRRPKNQKDTICLVGFPVGSFEKLLSEPQCKGFTVSQAGEDRIDVTVTAELIPDDYEPDLVMQDFAAWKGRLEVDEPVKDRKTGASVTTPGGPGVGGILQRILAFPVERKSPIECQAFLSEIRTVIAGIL